MPPTPAASRALEGETCADAVEIAELYARNFRGIRAWIAQQTSVAADGEDLAQETFLRAMLIADRYRGESSPESWLFGIARNIVRHHHRSLRAQKRGGDLVEVAFDEELGGAEPATPFDAVHARWDIDELAREARRAIGDRDWQLVAAHHIDEAPIEELASEAACSTSAIKSRLHRARNKLAPQLQHARALA